MKRSILVFCCVIVHFSFAYAQGPIKEWDVDLGAVDNEQLYSVQQTSDGGYILGGYSDSGISGDKTQASRGSSDYWIVKTDASGVQQWDARFGGTSVDQLTALQQTADGGYILGGFSFSNIGGDKTQVGRGQSDYWLVKTDGNGILQWDARFGGDSLDELHALQQTSDGGYILGGYSMSVIGGDQTHSRLGGKDYWIVKTDPNGIQQWDSRFGGAQFDELNSIMETADNGFIMGGYSLSGASGNKTQPNKGSYDYWIVKADANGTMEWDVDLGGLNEDWLTQLQQTDDGGYILGGWSWSGVSGDKTQPSNGDNDYWIIKTDANGVLLWDKAFGGNTNDYMYAIEQTIDGGYVLGGYSSSGVSGDKTQPTQGGTDYWLVKVAVNGVLQWDADFGGTDFDFLYALRQTNDGGYILGGYSSSDIGGDKTQMSKGVNDYWIIKTDGGFLSSGVAGPGAGASGLGIFPNPVPQYATLSFTLSEASETVIDLLDMSGRVIVSLADEKLAAGDHTIQFNRRSIQAGAYLLRVGSEEGMAIMKMVIE
ncbi:MAG: T9SS type A sorting domain-containing protein [Flavobacteriales bacterium]